MIVHECDRCQSRDMQDSTLIGWRKGNTGMQDKIRNDYQIGGFPADVVELCPSCRGMFDRFLNTPFPGAAKK